MTQNAKFGDNLQALRRDRGMSQKEFAEFLGVPQPSISTYENGHTYPTMEVLMTIAEKCNIPLDWLCGISRAANPLVTTGDIADFFYKLMETDEIKIDIEIQDRVDIPTETERNYVRLTIDWNDSDHNLNESLCNTIQKVHDHIHGLESFAFSKEDYEMLKKQTIEYRTTPVAQKKFPDLSREELIRKRREYLEAHPYE